MREKAKLEMGLYEGALTTPERLIEIEWVEDVSVFVKETSTLGGIIEQLILQAAFEISSYVGTVIVNVPVGVLAGRI